MRRHFFKLALGLCMVVLFASPPPKRVPPPPPPTVQPSGTLPVSWSVLAEGIRAQGEWYAAAASQAVTISLPVRRVTRVVQGTGACGGDLPPCSVMWCESHGNLTAQNPRSTASGKWEILDTTWRTEDSNGDGVKDNYQGYSRAMDAPESVQDDRARELWSGGRGASQWVCK